MTLFRRRQRLWTDADVQRALAILESWQDEHPGEFVWFAHTPEDEAEMRARFDPLGVPVVPVYPWRFAP